MGEVYTIRMVNCAFFARHGLFEAEEQLGQRFFVDAVLTVRASGPLDADEMETTVDYGRAFARIESIVTGKRRFLIEALARDIGRQLIADFPQIEQAEITVRKPNAPVPGILDHVEVTVVSRG